MSDIAFTDIVRQSVVEVVTKNTRIGSMMKRLALVVLACLTVTLISSCGRDNSSSGVNTNSAE